MLANFFADMTPLEHIAVHTHIRLFYPGVDVSLSLLLPSKIVDHAGYWVWCPQSKAHMRYTRDQLIELFGSEALAVEYIRSVLRVSTTYETVVSSLQILPMY